ncbi:MAG: MarC family protein [Rhodobacteraceae bacterium]|nr:MarC family protein [Paracoccaceae bacterium]
MFDTAAGAFATLFVIVDPIGLAPIFVALTIGAAPAERRRIAFGSVIIAAAILGLFGLFGEAAIAAIGVGLPAFRISGGIMLFLIALEMLFEKRTARRSRSAQVDPDHTETPDAPRLETDPTVFPLATPLLAGPGAMASMVLLTSGTKTTAEEVVVYACLALVLGLCLAFFLAASLIERALGPTGVNLVTRLFGVLLGALAVQFVLDGLADYGFVTATGG